MGRNYALKPSPSSPSAPSPPTSRSPTARSATGSGAANCPATSSAPPGGSTRPTSRPSSQAAGRRRHEARESPIKRRNPSGEIVWVARYTGRDGKRHIAKPTWNSGKGTFDRKARRSAGDRRGVRASPTAPTPSATTSPPGPSAIPESERTNATNEHRISRVLDVEVEGIPLKDWPLRELRRRHALVLVDHMLRIEGRATTGVVGILRSLSAMAEDAITDEVCDLNPFKGSPHPRQRSASAEKAPPDPRLQLRGDAPLRQGGRPLRGDGPRLHRHRHEAGGGAAPAPRRLRRRDAPGPPHRPRGHGSSRARRPTTASRTPAASSRSRRPSPGCSKPRSTSTAPTASSSSRPRRGRIWRERNFYRDVWKPTQEASGLDIRPHECRHSYVTHLRAAGVNDADLAEIAGHRVETMLARYTHAVGNSFGAVRDAVG